MTTLMDNQLIRGLGEKYRQLDLELDDLHGLIDRVAKDLAELSGKRNDLNSLRHSVLETLRGLGVDTERELTPADVGVPV